MEIHRKLEKTQLKINFKKEKKEKQKDGKKEEKKEEEKTERMERGNCSSICGVSCTNIFENSTWWLVIDLWIMILISYHLWRWLTFNENRTKQKKKT